MTFTDLIALHRAALRGIQSDRPQTDRRHRAPQPRLQVYNDWASI